MKLRRLVAASLCLCWLGAWSTFAKADLLHEWNLVFAQTIRETATVIGANAGPGPIARAGAMTFTAVHDAVNSVTNDYEPYLVNYDVAATTSKEAAAAVAAHRVLSSIYTGATQQTRFNNTLASQLAAIPDGPDKDAGIALGIASADTMIASRTGDIAPGTPYMLTPEAGYWRPAPGQSPITPNWGLNTPFTMTSTTQFRPSLPGGFSDMASMLASPEYAAQVNEVKELGALFSATRTADQTEIAHFWANDNTGTYKPTGHLNELTRVVAEQQGNSLAENARLYALTNLAMADAGIAAWDSKYLTDIDLWRPWSAIREIYDDGNPLTIADPSWVPLSLAINGNLSPAFPAYISGHATFGAAHAAVLAAFYGTDDIAFELTSDDTPGVTRYFDSFSQAALENGRSRVYLGVHYQWDSDAGYEVGTELGQYVYANFLRPVTVVVPEPSTIVMSAIGLLALVCFVRRNRR